MKRLLISLLLFFDCIDAFGDQLDGDWRLSVGSQTVISYDDGSFRIPNITTPDQFGETGSGSPPDFVSDDFMRLTGIKIESGKARYVWSAPFQLKNGQTFAIGNQDLTFSDTPLITPEFVRIITPKALLKMVGETVQLTTTAIAPDTTPDPADNPKEDVTPRAKFTVYRSSNPGVLTVNKDGLATARGNGRAIVTAVNSLVSGSVGIDVDTNNPTTIEGFVQRPDHSPFPGATVTVDGTTAIADQTGHFAITNVFTFGRDEIALTVAGPPTVIRSVVTVPGGISDAGVILVGDTQNIAAEFIVLFQGLNRPLNTLYSFLQTLFIAGEESAAGTIEIPRYLNSKLTHKFQVAKGGVFQHQSGDYAEIGGFGQILDVAVRVVADARIQVYGLNGFRIQGGNLVSSREAFCVIPVDALGKRYRVMSYRPSRRVLYTSIPSSQVAFAATVDNTTVTITPSTASFGGKAAGVPFNVTLDRLQAYQLQSAGDLTGSLLVADKPIAVFAGDDVVDMPESANDGAPVYNHLSEQIVPVEGWGGSFIAVPFADEAAGSADILRVLSDNNNTTVQIRGGSTIDAVLQAGEYRDFPLANTSTINADKPVLVAQYRGCVNRTIGGPSMLTLIPTSQFRTSYVVSADLGFTVNYINIVAKTADVAASYVLLDDTPVAISSFSILPNTDFSIARVPVIQTRHKISSANGLGVYVYGSSTQNSYAYPGVLGVKLSVP